MNMFFCIICKMIVAMNYSIIQKGDSGVSSARGCSTGLKYQTRELSLEGAVPHECLWVWLINKILSVVVRLVSTGRVGAGTATVASASDAICCATLWRCK